MKWATIRNTRAVLVFTLKVEQFASMQNYMDCEVNDIKWKKVIRAYRLASDFNDDESVLFYDRALFVSTLKKLWKTMLLIQ